MRRRAMERAFLRFNTTPPEHLSPQLQCAFHKKAKVLSMFASHRTTKSEILMHRIKLSCPVSTNCGNHSGWRCRSYGRLQRAVVMYFVRAIRISATAPSNVLLIRYAHMISRAIIASLTSARAAKRNVHGLEVVLVRSLRKME